jgi:hypothetical protein
MFLLPVLILLVVKVSAKCHISPLSTEYNITTDTIVSGTVKSFYMKESGGAFAGKVKVRRVFRGDKRVEGRMVMVEGFGSKNLCKASPRLGDTKLFILSRIKQSRYIHPLVYHLKLSDNIFKHNLRNLKILWKTYNQEKIGKQIVFGTDITFFSFSQKTEEEEDTTQLQILYIFLFGRG